MSYALIVLFCSAIDTDSDQCLSGVSMQEFGDKKSCVSAREQIQGDRGYRNRDDPIRSMCLPKGG